MNTLITAAPVQHTPTQRQVARHRHFYQDGKDLLQATSPKRKLVDHSAQALATYNRQLRSQAADIDSQDSEFISSLFSTPSQHEYLVDHLD